jgi:hypothetical protein
MQPVSNNYLQTLEQQVALEMYSRVYAEWELNAHYQTTVTGSASANPDLFPIESIAEPRRPKRRGLPKFIVGQNRVTNDATWPKFRVPDEHSNYKYYHSANRTSGTTLPLTTLSVNYAEQVPCNKLVVGFETSFAAPTYAQVFVTYDGTTWVSVGLHTPDADGLIQLWLQENNTWGNIAVMHESNYQLIRGMRITVNEMNRTAVGGLGVSVIQLSPRLSIDFTSRVIDVSTERQREQFDLTNPIGTAASATASITLANEDRLFDEENPSSPLARLIDRNVRFDTEVVLVRFDGISEAIPQGTFFADEWSITPDGQANVSCTDRSKFMQESIVENSFYWNQPSEFVVRDMLDRFGHPDYTVRYTQADSLRRIPYVFFKNDQTVWDALTSLAMAEQASFYFDEQDRFVWESRDYVWIHRATPVHTLRSNTESLNLANIVEWNPRFDIGANKVNIKYTPLQPATAGGGIVVNNVVWEETETKVLNSSPLRTNIPINGTIVNIVPEDHPFWPTDGIINVDGEYMRYTKSTVQGRLDIVERGLYNSKPKAHNINPINNFWSFYTAYRTSFSSNFQILHGNTSQARHFIRDSYLEIDMPSQPHSWNTAQYIGGSVFDRYGMYGTEIIFPVSFRWNGEPYYNGEGIAGLFMNSEGSTGGYYFEIVTTQFSLAGGHRKAEVRCWRRLNGVQTWLGTVSDESEDIFPNTGRSFEILPGQRYRLEVLHRHIDGQNHFTVFVNGTAVMGVKDNQITPASMNRGYWGCFVRMRTHARFEAVWAIDRTTAGTDIADIYHTIADRTHGGFNSGTLENTWSRFNQRYSDVVYEEFGPIVHGGIEYDVNYEISPNTATDLFMSNDQDNFIVYHERDPFKAKFAIVNAARHDSVLTGNDPKYDDEKMSLFVYGRPIVEQDENTIIREDDLARRQRGLEELELSSPWIQTKQRAERIADWLVSRWGKSNDIIEVQTIVAPHLQLGDLIQVSAPEENLYPGTHRYHVVGISRNVGSQHDMNLTLRRAR